MTVASFNILSEKYLKHMRNTLVANLLSKFKLAISLIQSWIDDNYTTIFVYPHGLPK